MRDPLKGIPPICAVMFFNPHQLKQHCESNLGAGGFWGLRGFWILETGIYVLQFQICLGLNPTLMMMVVVLVELCIGL